MKALESYIESALHETVLLPKVFLESQSSGLSICLYLCVASLCCCELDLSKCLKNPQKGMVASLRKWPHVALCLTALGVQIKTESLGSATQVLAEPGVEENAVEPKERWRGLEDVQLTFASRVGKQCGVFIFHFWFFNTFGSSICVFPLPTASLVWPRGSSEFCRPSGDHALIRSRILLVWMNPWAMDSVDNAWFLVFMKSTRNENGALNIKCPVGF